MKYRIYFNRANEAPQVWSVDEGPGEDGAPKGEINVQGFMVYVPVTSHVNLKADNHLSPKAWIETPEWCQMRVHSGVAFFDKRFSDNSYA